jgi:uncharacterized membrane protein (UPF0127 family)
VKKFKVILIILVSLLVILSAFFFAFIFFQPKAAAKQAVAISTKIYFSSQPSFIINAELAKTKIEWERGLMYRTSMAKNSGMLFVFPDESLQSFWMKNTKIPLDMLFISASGKIVDIKNNFLPCLTDTCSSYTSSAPAQYVLEINGGLAKKEGIKIGDSLRIKK